MPFWGRGDLHLPTNLALQLSSKENSKIYPLSADQIDKVSQEALRSLLDTAPVLHQYGGTKIVRLTQRHVMKAGSSVLPSEAENMRFAASHTSIRLPKVYRSFNDAIESGYFGTMGYIVMDYVDGLCLADCWNNLDNKDRENVTSQVASAIGQMQSVQLESPGPISGGRCQGKWFTDYSAGPFANAVEFQNWFNHKLQICKATGNAKQAIAPFKFEKFVLTHQDISPRNLIVNNGGKIWLIDWAFAGAYPPIFEAATLTDQGQFPDFSAQVLQQINSDSQQIEQLTSIGWGLRVAAFA